MKSRQISHFEIEEAINEFNQNLKDDFGNIIAQKIIGKYLIRVICRIENQNTVMITAYRTSKTSKYLNSSSN